MQTLDSRLNKGREYATTLTEGPYVYFDRRPLTLYGPDRKGDVLCDMNLGG